MSDRYNGFIVALEEPMKDEDAKRVINAIKMIKGVVGVEPQVADTNRMLAMMEVRNELGEKILKVIWPPKANNA